ncbi:HAD family hydrolase [Macrococcus hajekii]|uniref:HAD family hydrolase n=1 Tax=Macrococcus hajekii TaxID=198482 RepID=A0A4R6BI60_9STAP|nr:HAD family hydrolase [Macrococcus hajekii]TDM01211.1 HAD family hydrolase [Macrococcus hajekii]GGB11649.1 phosphoglycolate phosphatase [Macrococcus hajekii]
MAKLIVFDKDGTLMELGSFIVKLADDLINEFSSRTDIHVPKSEIKDAFGIVDDKLDQLMQSTSAKSIVNKLRLLPNGDQLADWTNQKMEYLSSDSELTDIKIIAGVPDLLKRLKQAGYQLAIVSADDTKSMDLFIDKFDIRSYFDLIVTSDNSSYQKPKKALMDEILLKLNVSASETVMVGDTEMDVQLGRNGQVSQVIGVLSGSGDEQDLRDADMILDSVADIKIEQIK